MITFKLLANFCVLRHLIYRLVDITVLLCFSF